MITLICKKCNLEFIRKNSKYKFCSNSCSASYNNIGRTHTEKTKEKIKVKLKDTNKKSGIDFSKLVGNRTKGMYLAENFNSIYDLSSTTKSKIIKRLKIKCCICGWDEDIIDIHHINGRKIENANAHENLTPLCPNHHRLIHSGKLDKNLLISLDKIFPVNWKDFYYG